MRFDLPFFTLLSVAGGINSWRSAFPIVFAISDPHRASIFEHSDGAAESCGAHGGADELP